MGQRDSQKTKIDDTEYEVFMLPPRKARRILVEMGKVVGPVLGGVMDAGGDLTKVLEADVDWQAVIAGLTERLSDEMLGDHMDELAKITTVNGKGYLHPVFDAHFMGDVGGMFKWYAFALKANFGNFFSALGSVSGSLTEAAKGRASQSPST